MQDFEPRFHLLLVALLNMGLFGCGSSGLCARSSDCTLAGSVCGLNGRCESLSPPEGARFAGSRWLHPIDWGVSGGRGPLSDAFPVGGPNAIESLLAFDSIPPPSEILRALLVLSPHERQPRQAEPAELVVEHVEPFGGGVLPPRQGAQPLRFAVARRPIAAGPARTVRLDVTEAARAAGSREDERLYLLVRTRDAAGPRSVVYASPWHEDHQARPRIELLVH